MAIPWKRLLHNALATRRGVHSAFPASTRRAIEEATRQAELNQSGELRFVVEAALHSRDVWLGVSARDRAIDLFGLLRMWDTERRNGVLIYLLLAEHRIEIVADRGIARWVPQHDWDAACRELELAFQRGEFEAGALHGIRRVAELIGRAAASATVSQPPVDDRAPHGAGELPDRPLVLPD